MMAIFVSKDSLHSVATFIVCTIVSGLENSPYRIIRLGESEVPINPCDYFIACHCATIFKQFKSKVC